MVDPKIALAWFAVLMVLLAVVVWPKWGAFPRIARIRLMTERVQIEDALKHALHRELADQRATVESLAGVMEVSRSRAHALLERLAALGLARNETTGVVLTEDGRGYALRVLRTHRLLERYFADRTGVAPADWHELAEAGEHALSDAEVEALAARMGHPAYDPHGDPIPTAQGQLPPPQGLPVAALIPGQAAVVVHVEDEPASAYHRLLSLGINVAVPVKMMAVQPNEIELLVGGIPRRLDPLLATAVAVQPVVESAGHTVLFDRLDSLRPGERAEVVEIAPTVQGPQRRRLLDLGLLPGTVVTAEMMSPAGDPMAYRIRGALIALRRPQARGIYIKQIPATTTGAAA